MSEIKAGRKRKIPLLYVVYIVVSLVGGFVVGWVSVQLADHYKNEVSILLLTAFVVVSLYLQLFIHEGGHLVAGLLSGYSFSSFRLGSFVIKKENGIWKTARMSIPGTGGQCLLDPPEIKDGKFPVVMYNLGGVAANVVFSGICLFSGAILSGPVALRLFLFILGGVGMLCALINGIPFSTALVANDGYNTWMLSRNPEAAKSFYTQLKVNHLLSQNIRLKDMPEGLVYLPSKTDWQNSMITAAAVLYENKLLDEKKYSDAKQLAVGLLTEARLLGIYEQLLRCDVFCLALIDGDSATYSSLYSRDLKQFCRQMKDLPSTLRTQYIAALLFEKDLVKAEKIKNRFESKMKKYPNPAELYSEIELMDLARKVSEGNGPDQQELK